MTECPKQKRNKGIDKIIAQNARAKFVLCLVKITLPVIMSVTFSLSLYLFIWLLGMPIFGAFLAYLLIIIALCSGFFVSGIVLTDWSAPYETITEYIFSYDQAFYKELKKSERWAKALQQHRRDTGNF